MLLRVAVVGLVAAGSVLVGSPASASNPFACSWPSEGRGGASAKCDYGKYVLNIKCSVLGPLTGPDKKFSSLLGSNGATVRVLCPTGYYYQPGTRRWNMDWWS